MNPGKDCSVDKFVWWVFMIALGVMFVGCVTVVIWEVYDSIRDIWKRRMRLKNEILPKFEAEFGCGPKLNGTKFQVRERRAQLSRHCGVLAIAQERAKILETISFRRNQFDGDLNEAKVNWGRAMALIKEADWEVYMLQPHWSEDEPYRSHIKNFHADID